MGVMKTLSQIKEQREFTFSKKDFFYIQDFMLRETGISLSERKTSMVYGRLARRLRHTGIDNFKAYFTFANNDIDERIAFINALTTNKTQFFREKHHFDYVEKVLIPLWKQQEKTRVRLWSAGCSTGEEPYSIAAVFAFCTQLEPECNCKILATDLDTQALEVAINGTYALTSSASIPQLMLRNGFIRGKGKKQSLLKVKTQLQNTILFKQLNLIADWNHKGPFDAIFCRNVMIYFEKDLQQRLIYRFWEKLNVGGILFLGHSESIGEMGSYFEHLGQTMFRKR